MSTLHWLIYFEPVPHNSWLINSLRAPHHVRTINQVQTVFLHGQSATGTLLPSGTTQNSLIPHKHSRVYLIDHLMNSTISVHWHILACLFVAWRSRGSALPTRSYLRPGLAPKHFACIHIYNSVTHCVPNATITSASAPIKLRSTTFRSLVTTTKSTLCEQSITIPTLFSAVFQLSELLVRWKIYSHEQNFHNHHNFIDY